MLRRSIRLGMTACAGIEAVSCGGKGHWPPFVKEAEDAKVDAVSGALLLVQVSLLAVLVARG